MSWQATTWVIEHSQHKGSALLTLLMLANHASPEGRDIYPSLKSLTKNTRLSRSQVKRIVRRLLDSGELVAVGSPQGSPLRTNCYDMPGVRGSISEQEGSISDFEGSILPPGGVIAMNPEQSLERSLEQPFELKTRSAPENAPTPDQEYLLRRLFEANSNWSEVTIPAIVQLNQKWGTEVVRAALGRLRESMPETRKPYGLLAAVCAEIAKESA